MRDHEDEATDETATGGAATGETETDETATEVSEATVTNPTSSTVCVRGNSGNCYQPNFLQRPPTRLVAGSLLPLCLLCRTMVAQGAPKTTARRGQKRSFAVLEEPIVPIVLDETTPLGVSGRSVRTAAPPAPTPLRPAPPRLRTQPPTMPAQSRTLARTHPPTHTPTHAPADWPTRPR